jgi:glucan 1,3-beta-glucosidase
VSGRTLGHGEPVPGGASAMTIEACQTVCQTLGYTLAGVEYADECCMFSHSARLPF